MPAGLPVNGSSASPSPVAAVPGAQPVRHRRRDWRPVFLKAIAEHGNATLAAHAAGVDRSTAYKSAERDAAFAAAWAEAREEAIDLLEAEAFKRAHAGSDRVLLFLLQTLRSQLYRNSIDVRVDFRREAERVAERLRVPVEEVLERVEQRIKEAR